MSYFGQKVSQVAFPSKEKDPIAANSLLKKEAVITTLPSDDIYKTRTLSESPQLTEFKDRVFDRLLKNIDLTAAARMPASELRREVEHYIFEFTEETHAQLNHKELQHVTDEIINDMLGLGPLEVILADPSINDIMVNAFDSVYVERFGKLMLTDVKFRSERHVLQIAQRIANQIGRRIDEASPMVDARLKDGSRVNIIIPPLALEGTSISIRKFSRRRIYLKDLAHNGSLSQAMFEFLKIASMCRLNIIVSGGTGAGKTTILNALSELIDPHERIVTIEDSAELKMMQPHVVRLESRPANLEGQGTIHIQDLVKNALRMRPDRIIVGECRGAETFDMLQAMNTGHDGSMSTLHANSAREAVNRLENMVLMTGHDLPNTVIKSYIKDAVDLIVHVARLRDGSRKVTQITEITGLTNGEIQTQDIFKYDYTTTEEGKIEGQFRCMTQTPHVEEKFIHFGMKSEMDKALKMGMSESIEGTA